MAAVSAKLAPDQKLPGEDALALTEELHVTFMHGLTQSSDVTLFGRMKTITEKYFDDYAEQSRRFNALYDELTDSERLRALKIWNMWDLTTDTAHVKAHDHAMKERQRQDDFPGQLIKGALQRAARSGADKETMERILQGIFIIMFTAHPTQSAPEEYVAERRRYVNAVLNNKPEAMHASLDRCMNLIQPVRDRNKTGEEELAETLDHLENIFWVYPSLFNEVKATLEALKWNYPDRGYGDINLDRYETQAGKFFRAILWPRADADGNPNATAEETQQGVWQVQRFMNRLYCSALYGLLTGPEAVQSDSSKQTIGELLYRMAMNDEENLPDEIRTWLDTNHAKFADCKLAPINPEDDPGLEIFNKELGNLMWHESDQTLNNIQGLIRRARAFGWHFGKFDIRQDARIHRGLMDYVMPGLNGKNPDQRTELLNEKLGNLTQDKWRKAAARALKKIDGDLEENENDKPVATRLKEIKNTLLRLKDVVPKHPDHFDRYIISNCAQVSDALDLLALFKATGTEQLQRMVFLRESHKDLVSLPGFIGSVCRNREFLKYIAQHDYNIEIMVAMSDTQRQDGPSVLFAQRQGVVDAATEMLRINRERRAAKLPPLTLTITAGGSDDIVRGGNDPSSYFHNISREIYAAGRMEGFEPDEIAALLRPEILRTVQGRDVENDFGDRTSAGKKLEQHAAAGFNWQRFLVMQSDKWEKNGLSGLRKLREEISSLERNIIRNKYLMSSEDDETAHAMKDVPQQIIEDEQRLPQLIQRAEAMERIYVKKFLAEEEKLIQPFKANRHAQQVVEENCMWVYHSFRGATLDDLSTAVVPATATRTINQGYRPLSRPSYNHDDHTDSIGNGIDAALAALALPLTDTRAITNEFAVELSKLHLQGWLGFSGLANVAPEELYKMYNDSNCFQDTLIRVQMEMMKTNFDHAWDLWKRTHKQDDLPAAAQKELYANVFGQKMAERHGEQLTDDDLKSMMADLSLADNYANRSKVILSWLQQEFVKTDKVIGQIQFGCEQGAEISAAERFKVYPRQYAEMMSREAANRLPSIWLARMHGDYYATHDVGDPGRETQDQTYKLAATMCVDTQRTAATFLNLSPGPQEMHMEYRKRGLHEDIRRNAMPVAFRDRASKAPTHKELHYSEFKNPRNSCTLQMTI